MKAVLVNDGVAFHDLSRYTIYKFKLSIDIQVIYLLVEMNNYAFNL